MEFNTHGALVVSDSSSKNFNLIRA